MDASIVHVILGKANPERMNGVNKVVNSLATHQTQMGHHVIVCGITKTVVHNYPPRNYITKLFMDHSKWKLDTGLKAFLASLSQETTVHIHGGFIPQFFMVARHLVRHRIPYVYTTHGSFNTVAMRRSKWKKRVYIQLFERYLTKNAKCLHFIGASEVEGASKVIDLHNYALIPNGQAIQKLPLQQLPVRIPFVLGFCGRIDIHTKGLDLLLQGIASYDRMYPAPVRLEIIGDGTQLEELKNLAEQLGVASMLRFHGSKFGEDKYQIMRQWDTLVLNSRNEGLPGVVLEGLGMAIPVLISEETNMGAYVRDYEAGKVLDQNTPEQIALRIRELIDLKDEGTLEDLGSNAYQLAIDKFDWSKIAAQHLNVYAA